MDTQKKIIHLSDTHLLLSTHDAYPVGKRIAYKIQMPDAAHIESLVIPGTVVDCKFHRQNGSSHYLLNIVIDELPAFERQVLHAYIDFLDRDRELNAIATDHEALQRALERFGQNLAQLVSVAELLLNRSREQTEKPTIH